MTARLLSTGSLVLLSSSLLALSAAAFPLGNGRTTFERAPRLIRAATNSRQTGMPRATYHFTISVPENAGEPMQAVTISQRQGIDAIAFKTDKSRAFEGDSFAGGPEIPLASIGGSQPTDGDTTVVFDPPVPPGKTVTVALQAKRNPNLAGIYLFGVTAYPVGEGSPGLYLGSRRFTFIRGN
ncbi:DUF2808 domain-containing protein [Pleurocapsales cyanobacterium LEGE 06147]|nr:DUF2808 domain-containing protein [Pleurocapsales cyanobacterium LEGE 06147]